MRRSILVLSILTILFACTAAFAGPVREIIDGLGGFKTVSGALGFSVLGLLGIIGLLRTAVDETLEAVGAVKAFILKYQKKFTTGEGRTDFRNMLSQIDDSLESVADVLDRIPFLKKHARKLRDIIQLHNDYDVDVKTQLKKRFPLLRTEIQ